MSFQPSQIHLLVGWSSLHWRRPNVLAETEPDRIVLELPMFSIIPEETLSDLKIMFSENVETLGKDEITALAVCHIEGDITNIRLQYLVERHKTDITKMLQNLCKNGYLLSESKSRWTTYHLNYEDNVDSTISNVDSSASNMDSSMGININPATVGAKDTNSKSVDDYNDNMDSSDVISVDTSTSKQTRFEFEEIASKIIEICLLAYKSVAQIAQELNKSEKYLKNSILPKLISNEKLTKLHADNHPNQKYIAKK